MSNLNSLLEKYNPETLKEKLNSLSNTLKDVDVRAQGYGIDKKHNLRRHCLDCDAVLKTWGAKRCKKCNMKLIGRNHIEARKRKGGA
jgi:uncharacterized paraquat-inducible protein A